MWGERPPTPLQLQFGRPVPGTEEAAFLPGRQGGLWRSFIWPDAPFPGRKRRDWSCCCPEGSDASIRPPRSRDGRVPTPDIGKPGISSSSIRPPRSRDGRGSKRERPPRHRQCFNSAAPFPGRKRAYFGFDSAYPIRAHHAALFPRSKSRRSGARGSTVPQRLHLAAPFPDGRGPMSSLSLRSSSCFNSAAPFPGRKRQASREDPPQAQPASIRPPRSRDGRVDGIAVVVPGIRRFNSAAPFPGRKSR